MDDITEHKFSDCNISSDIMASRFSIRLATNQVKPTLLSLNKSDAIAIARHFGIIKEIDGQRVTIHKSTTLHSERYIKSRLLRDRS